MKKGMVLIVLAMFFIPPVFSAIVTNTNQSVLFFRFPSRNASTDLDAVCYNPAGLVRLADGFHVAIHNQTIFQDKKVINYFLLLNDREYLGKTRVPVFPNFYAIYKKKALAISFGFGPIAGGGSADYSQGLPSFEVPISALPAMLTAAGLPTTKYLAEINFKGSSIYYGFQMNATYALSNVVSAAFGLRYVQAVNKYEGEIKNIQINPTFPALGWTGQMRSAPQAFSTLYLATGNPNFLYYASATADKGVEAKQVGSGLTPIVGLHIEPTEKLKIGFRYEFNTKLELENQPTRDDVGMFPAGKKERDDIPANFSVGTEYLLSPVFKLSFSYTLFLEKQANWDGKEKLLDGNSYDLALAFEYEVSRALSLSAGYIYTKTGAGQKYQSDLSFDLGSNTFGAGVRIKLSPKLDIDLGGVYVMYNDFTKKGIAAPSPLLPAYDETYKQSTYAFGLGFNFHL
ncbi:MAG: outer membrane protein transport protein [Candidatus Aminicenantes bacterium]|nr:outer membrane protein transport protein [Candidatus Aminicenantes bacterium]